MAAATRHPGHESGTRTGAVTRGATGKGAARGLAAPQAARRASGRRRLIANLPGTHQVQQLFPGHPLLRTLSLALGGLTRGTRGAAGSLYWCLGRRHWGQGTTRSIAGRLATCSFGSGIVATAAGWSRG